MRLRKITVRLKYNGNNVYTHYLMLYNVLLKLCISHVCNFFTLLAFSISDNVMAVSLEDVQSHNNFILFAQIIARFC